MLKTLLRAFVYGLIHRDEKVDSSTKHNQFKGRMQKPYHETKMAKIDTPLLTNTAKRPNPLGPHIPI